MLFTRSFGGRASQSVSHL